MIRALEELDSELVEEEKSLEGVETKKQEIYREEQAVKQAMAQADQILKNVLEISIVSRFGDEEKARTINEYIVRRMGIRDPEQIQAAIRNMIYEARKRIQKNTPVIDKLYYLVLQRVHGDYDR